MNKPKIKDSDNKNFKSFPEILMSKSQSKATSNKSVAISSAPKVPARKIVKDTFKKQKIELPQEHDSYFVYLRNPLEYRRHLLESSRKILYCLKNHNNITVIRQRKLDEMKKLRSTVRELLYLNKKFNDKLPKYAAISFEGQVSPVTTKPIVPKAVKPKKVIEAPKSKTEMDKLEESLANVERKLQGLK